ncbi:MAG TPA: hypothetical protein V6C97_27800 [Oculatellaceae cyanobacterium]
MKAKEHETIEPKNLKTLREQLKANNAGQTYEGFLAILADVVDTAIGGSECYAVLGLNRNRDAVMLTVTIGREKLYATGPTLVAVSKAAEELL